MEQHLKTLTSMRTDLKTGITLDLLESGDRNAKRRMLALTRIGRVEKMLRLIAKNSK